MYSDIYWMTWYHDSMDTKPVKSTKPEVKEEVKDDPIEEPVEETPPAPEGLDTNQEDGEEGEGTVPTPVPDV